MVEAYSEEEMKAAEEFELQKKQAFRNSVGPQLRAWFTEQGTQELRTLHPDSKSDLQNEVEDPGLMDRLNYSVDLGDKKDQAGLRVINQSMITQKVHELCEGYFQSKGTEQTNFGKEGRLYLYTKDDQDYLLIEKIEVHGPSAQIRFELRKRLPTDTLRPVNA